METNVSSQSISKDGKVKNKKIVAAIGRWMPPHNGHKLFLTKLAKDDEFEKTIAEYVKKLTVDINDYAVDQFKVKNIKEPQTSY